MMSRDISCSIVKDLLPNYIDQLTSEDTNCIIENHLLTCSNCSKERDEMMERIEMKTIPENQNMRNYLNKTKMMYLLKGTLLSIGIIGIIVSFIVDLAVNKKLTWSLIVDIGTLYLYFVGLTAIVSRQHKIIKAIAVGSILVLPMLYGMEYVINANYMTESVSWFSKCALPITAIWIAILWITIIIRRIAKLSIWNALGVLLIMAVFGSALTNSIAESISIKETYTTGYEWISSVFYVTGAITSFIVGYKRNSKNKSV